MEPVGNKVCFFRLFFFVGIAFIFGLYPTTNAEENKLYSFKELRDKNVVRQRYDFSCGAASLATILKYDFGLDVTEWEIINKMLSDLSKSEFDIIAAKGFSMLDLKHLIESYGLWAQGYYLNFDHMRHLKYPVILFIVKGGYKHFIVSRGVDKNHIHIGDPSCGNRMIHISRFAKNWDGTALVIVPVLEKASFLSDQTLKLPKKITKDSAFRSMNRSLDFINFK